MPWVPYVVPRFDVRFALLSGLATGLYLGAAVWGWGEASSFLAHPARRGLVVSSMALTAAAWFSGLSAFSRGRRAASGARWIFVPLAIVSLGLAWLPPYADRRNLGTLDGDVARYLGLVTFLIGSLITIGVLLSIASRA